MDFAGLDCPDQFDAVKARKTVTTNLDKKSVLSEPGNNICIHGYRVTIKDRTFKRPSSLLKHARFI